MNEAIHHTIDLIQPGTTVQSEATELLRVADILQYPLIIRSSSSQESEKVKIIHNSAELHGYLK